MLGHKTSLSKLKKTESISSIFSSHGGMKLDINFKKTGKFENTWRLKNMQLNNQRGNEKIKREIERYLWTNESGNTTY